jgi:hypothetical protein
MKTQILERVRRLRNETTTPNGRVVIKYYDISTRYINRVLLFAEHRGWSTFVEDIRSVWYDGVLDKRNKDIN